MEIKPESAGLQPSKPMAQMLNSIYFNGYIINLSNADVGAMLLLNGQPAVNLQMSYTTAKTLSKTLGDAIQSLEALMGRTIMEATDIADKMNQDNSNEPH